MSDRIPYIWKAKVNGCDTEASVSKSARLIDLLREELKLTGVKRSCDIGRCGACMVLMDGKAVNSCLVMAYQCEGSHITTIEGVGSEGSVDPIQQALLEEGGFQCGYCTPGFVLSIKALLNDNKKPDIAELEAQLSGNLCRCTGYGGIRRALEKLIAEA